MANGCHYCVSRSGTAGVIHEADCPVNPNNKKEKPDVNATLLYGWRCPKCGRGNAPWNATCPCGPDVKTISVSSKDL